MQNCEDRAGRAKLLIWQKIILKYIKLRKADELKPSPTHLPRPRFDNSPLRVFYSTSSPATIRHRSGRSRGFYADEIPVAKLAPVMQPLVGKISERFWFSTGWG